MYRNLRAAGLGDFRDGGVAENFNYWTSTQASADMADRISTSLSSDEYHYDDKDFPAAGASHMIFLDRVFGTLADIVVKLTQHPTPFH